MTYVVVAVRYLLGAVFALAAATTIADRRPARRFLTALAGLRRPVSAVLTAAVVTETGVAGLLLIPMGEPAARVGFVAALVLLALYTVILGAALRRRVAEPCGCLGSSVDPVGPGHLVRNGLLGALAVVGFAGSVGAARPVGGEVVVAAALGVFGAVVVARFADLIALYAPRIRENR